MAWRHETCRLTSPKVYVLETGKLSEYDGELEQLVKTNGQVRQLDAAGSAFVPFESEKQAFGGCVTFFDPHSGRSVDSNLGSWRIERTVDIVAISTAAGKSNANNPLQSVGTGLTSVTRLHTTHTGESCRHILLIHSSTSPLYIKI